MPEASEQISPIATGSWMWRILGIAVGTATLVSLVKSGFSIELYGLPAKVYQNYAWLRDIVFEPLVWALSYWLVLLASWMKDLIAAYGLIAAAHWRALSHARSLPHSLKADVRAWLLVLALLWPVLDVWLFWEERQARRASRKYRAAARQGNTHPGDGSASKTFVTAGYLEVLAGHRLWLSRVLALGIFGNLVAVVIATTLFFLWSHITVVYGPN